MRRIKITQIKSTIDRPERQRKNLVALGIKKMNQSVEHNATPQILGIVNKVNHLVKIEELN
ncbi:MAG: 50S ribosomal protein L30 [Bacteroidota bacterium]